MQGFGRRGVGLLVLALGLLAASPAVRGEEAPTSVVDWLHAAGRDASFEARTRLFEARFPGEAYAGRAEQNVRLLEALRGGNAPDPARGPAAGTPAAPPTRHTVSGHGWRVTFDRGTQVLQLDVPERVTWEQRPGRREDPVLPTLPTPATGSLFVSAALLGVKAKQFDDGLYAAVEVASRAGHGGLVGKHPLLEMLRRTLVQGAAGRGAAVVCAARDYGSGRHGDPLPDALRAAVQREKAAFERSPLRSKPIGFYTWSDELFRVFRQDRMLQSGLTAREDVEAVAAALRAEPWQEAAYRKHLRLAARLTNPLVGPDVLQPPTARGPHHVLPPSRSHETELAKRLWGQSVPEGANLFEELIRRVRDGSLSLAPRADSGWYDHQTWALEPLLSPEAQPEAKRLAFTQGYRDHLEALFKGLLALTRETHVKQLENPMAGACQPPPTIHVGTGLTVEPLATHYRRRADAYRFVREVLEEAFGEGALASMRRLTIDGPVGVDLDTELDLMTRLFDGAAETALIEIGSSDADGTARGAAARAVFATWRALAGSDPDVVRDCRMMVPVFYDLERRKTKVWVFLGWRTLPLTISYVTLPEVVSWERLPGASEERPELGFFGQTQEIAYPVVAEVYVAELLDRRALRALCDRHETRTAILAALR
jgi:hypothetical protein